MRRAVAILSVLAAGCASVPHRTVEAFPDRLTGLGTEPFWSVTLNGERLGLEEPERGLRTAFIERRQDGGALEIHGRLDGMGLHARLERRACSDGMSDRVYPFELAMTWGPRILRGCAYPTASIPSNRPDAAQHAGDP